MAEAGAQNFVDLVKRSQLVEEEQLERFLAKLRTENGGKLPDKARGLGQCHGRRESAHHLAI